MKRQEFETLRRALYAAAAGESCELDSILKDIEIEEETVYLQKGEYIRVFPNYYAEVLDPVRGILKFAIEREDPKRYLADFSKFYYVDSRVCIDRRYLQEIA